MSNTSNIFLDICHQVLDLYSQANNTKPPDSPPMIPSSEVCKERAITVTTIESASNTPNGNNNDIDDRNILVTLLKVCNNVCIKAFKY